MCTAAATAPGSDDTSRGLHPPAPLIRRICASGHDAAALDTIAETLARIAGGEPPEVPEGVADRRPWTVRLMADDLKAFYFEAAAAQPRSRAPSSDELNRWLFGETALADVVYAARDALIAHEDAAWQAVGRTLTPAAFARRPGS